MTATLADPLDFHLPTARSLWVLAMALVALVLLAGAYSGVLLPKPPTAAWQPAYCWSNSTGQAQPCADIERYGAT